MPATLPVIVTPLPSDPRVMKLATATGLKRREAFGAAAEAWSWLAAHAVNGIVPATEPDTLDGIVDVPGIGQAMLAAGLVGVVNDGLVLPGELRHQQRDDAEPRRRHRGDDAGGDTEERRREGWRDASRRYRRRTKVTAPQTQPTTSKPCRCLGRVAGREVRIYDGPHGCYARVIGATLDGQGCGKFTAGDKAWSLEDVTLVDVLPALVAKWKTLTTARGLADPPRAEPTYDAFREDAERLTMLEQFTRAEAAGGGDEPRHDDASCRHQRHDDASSSVIESSSATDPAGERKPSRDEDLPRHHASSGAADDGPSSSSLSKSSSSNEEEDMRGGREAGSIDDDKPAAYREWEAKRQRTDERDARIAAALGIDIGTVRLRHRDYLALQCSQAGIDFRTGLPLNAGGSHEPAGARTTLPATVEPMDDAEPATGSVVARERRAPQHDTRTALAGIGATVTPRRVDDIGDDDAVTQHDRDTLRQGA
jgi:hypothetical protein